MSEMLEKARKYEDEQGKQIKAEDRPAFHVSPYIGWMNDPNGFSYYQGEYHLFYQYYPYDTHWNSMHWGHVVSKDLLHWEYLPAAYPADLSGERVFHPVQRNPDTPTSFQNVSYFLQGC